MKTKILLFICLSLSSIFAYGQRSLAYKDIKTDMNVFSGLDDEAGMVFTCPSSIPLTFESSHDKVVDIYQTEIKGDNTVYYIRFKVGRRYDGRKLTVIAPDFRPLVFQVDLSPKELKQYSLFDPDEAFVYGCYYEYRRRGADYFQQGMYQEAKEQYSIAKECSDCPQNSDLSQRIADIDSIFSYQKQAEIAEEMLDYKLAADLYLKALQLNPQDNSLVSRKVQVEQLYTTDCNRYLKSADAYYSNGDYDKALELYTRVVDANCLDTGKATDRIGDIYRILSNRKQRATVIVYEWSKATPIGISIGRYKTKKVGGYWSLAFHPDIFKAMQHDYEATDKFEIGSSFGITTPQLGKLPVWLFGGFGIVFNGNFIPDEDIDTNPHYGYTTDEYGNSVQVDMSSSYDEEDLMKFDPSLQFAGEGGIVVKFKFLALRYTFQYRFPTDKEKKDDILYKMKHSIGIGICF